MQWRNRLEFCGTTQHLRSPHHLPEPEYEVFTRSPSFQNLPVCRPIGCVVHPVFCSSHDTQLVCSSDQGLENNAIFHARNSMFVLLRACCVYYGDLAGFEPWLQQRSCSHRSLQRLCQWIPSGSNQEPCMSIMEKLQSPATWAPQKKFWTHLWSRKASCDSFLSQPGLFC